MNYILYHKGAIPEHLKYCINTILSVDKHANVHLITDQIYSQKSLSVININDLGKLNFLLSFKKNLSKYNLLQNPLWLTSLERIFYINEYVQDKKIDEFIHFDNDVLIYEPFETIKEIFSKGINGFYITPLNETNLVFGYSYSDSNEVYEKICKEIKKIVNDYEYHQKKYNQNKPLNEMKILSIVDRENSNLIQKLPILPHEGLHIFDPASYGQFLGGTHQKPKTFFRSNFVTQTHTVGIELISKRIKFYFDDRSPSVTSELGHTSRLNNLHIHSKKLEKYVPSVYREFN